MKGKGRRDRGDENRQIWKGAKKTIWKENKIENAKRKAGKDGTKEKAMFGGFLLLLR